MKIAEFTRSPVSPRKEFLAQQAGPLNLPTDLDYTLLPDPSVMEGGEDIAAVIAKNWRAWTKDQSAIFVDDSFSEMFTHIIPGMPQRVLQSRKVDFLSRDSSNKWWPECVLRDQLHKSIVQAAPRLDCSRVAYITGPNFNMHVALAVVSQLGFPRVNLVIDDMELGVTLLAEIQRIFFGVDIRILGTSDLTMQKNDGSILINTISSHERPELMQDLSYLNYILADSLVVDLNPFPEKNPLLDECQHVGVKTLLGPGLRGLCDWSMMQKLLPKWQVSAEDYIALWLEFLQRNPVGP